MCLPLCQSQYLEGRYCDWSLLGHMLTPLSARRSLIGQPTRTTEWGRSKQERSGLLEGQGEAGVFLGTWPGISMPSRSGCRPPAQFPPATPLLHAVRQLPEHLQGPDGSAPSHLPVCSLCLGCLLPPARQMLSLFKVSGVTSCTL